MSHTSTKGKINRESHSSHATSELRRDSSVIETRIIRWGNTEEEAAQDTYENESEKLGKFAKLLRKEKHRFEYLTWGETSPTPVIYSQLQDYKMKQVQCGGKHFLALSESGIVFAWGTGSSGQLGLGNPQSQDSPTLIPTLERKIVVRVDANAAQSAALTHDGELFLWGWRGGEPTLLPTIVKEMKDQSVLQVSLGAFHIAALVSDRGRRLVFTWGNGSRGQLGHGNLNDVEVPTVVQALADVGNVTAISGAENNTGAVINGTVYLWGDNSNGVLGVGSTEQFVSIPKEVLGFEGIDTVKLVCSYGSTAAVSTKGDLFCWGENKSGQLGLGHLELRETKARRVKFLFDQKVVGVSAGHKFMVAWTDEKIFAWGDNNNNKLGIPSEKRTSITSPTVIESLSGRAVFTLSCGSRFVIACLGQPLFGVPLECTLLPNEDVPAIFSQCLEYLQDHETENIFQFSGNIHQQKLLQSYWNAGYFVHLFKCPDPHLIAGLLKHFLSQLPDPIFSNKLYQQFLSLQGDHSLSIINIFEGVQILFNLLPDVNKKILVQLLGLFGEIMENRKSSLMSAKSLAQVFAPILFKPEKSSTPGQDLPSLVALLETMLTFHEAISSENSQDLISNIAIALVDSGADEVEAQAQQVRLWSEWLVVLSDPSANMQDGTNFFNAFMESQAVPFSIQSALINFPHEEGLRLLKQLIVLYFDANLPVDELCELLESLQKAKIDADIRKTFLEMIVGFQQLRPSSDLSEKLSLLKKQTTDLNYELADNVKVALLNSITSLQQLLEIERQRSILSKSRAAPSFQHTYEDLTRSIQRKQRTSNIEALRLEESRETFNDSNSLENPVVPDSVKEATAEVSALEIELENLKLALQQKKELIQSGKEKFERLTRKKTVVENQKKKDDLEAIRINLETKNNQLRSFREAEEKWKDLIQNTAIPHLKKARGRIEASSLIIERSSKSYLLLAEKFLDISTELLSPLRKRMRRYKTDIKDRIYSSEMIRLMEKSHEGDKALFLKTKKEVEEMIVSVDEFLLPLESLVQNIEKLPNRSHFGEPIQNDILIQLLAQQNIPSFRINEFHELLISCGIIASKDPEEEKVSLLKIRKKFVKIEKGLESTYKRHFSK